MQVRKTIEKIIYPIVILLTKLRGQMTKIVGTVNPQLKLTVKKSNT